MSDPQLAFVQAACVPPTKADVERGMQETGQATFRRNQSERATRILDWMGNASSQLWSVVALRVTDRIARTIGNYLQDEYMYHPAHTYHDASAERPWLPQRPGRKDHPAPTLMSFMSGDLAALPICV